MGDAVEVEAARVAVPLDDPLLHTDLRRHPEHYPGPRAPGPGLLTSCGWVATEDVSALERLLTEGGVTGMGARQVVLGVGANAAPAVLAAKLAWYGAAPLVPMTPGTVDDLAVAHSAHVSPGGYLPAAPYTRPGARGDVVAAWLDPEQLACVDATEPNYERFDLDLRRHRLTLTGWRSAPRAVMAYRSRRGLLRRAALAEPLPLGAQSRAHAVLRSAGVPIPTGCATTVCRLLASDPSLRARVAEGIIERGLRQLDVDLP